MLSSVKLFTNNPVCLNTLTYNQSNSKNNLSSPVDSFNFLGNVKKFDFKPKEYFAPASEYSRLFRMKCENEKARHAKRMELYGSENNEPIRQVSKSVKKAIDIVQWEEDGYNDLISKMRNKEPLNKQDQKLYSFISSQMQPSNKDITLWRAITPYSGFKDEVCKGCVDFRGFSSCAKTYSDFFDFWTQSEIAPLDTDTNTLVLKEGYILKINVPKGTKILDCNAYYKPFFAKKPFYPRMKDETLLPEGDGVVKNIDDELHVIEIDFNPLHSN